MEHLIIQHLSSPMGARLNKIYCTRTWNQSRLLETSCGSGYFLYGYKNIFPSSVQLLADLPSYQNLLQHQHPDPPPFPQKITVNHFNSQEWSFQLWPCKLISQIQLTFLDTVEMGLITDMQTYKSPNLVQLLFNKTLHFILTTHLFFYVYILVFFCI